MSTRRDFLLSLAGTGAAALGVGVLRNDALERVRCAASGVRGRDAVTVARDEDFWLAVQQAFRVNRNVLNLNNGGVCPSPGVVQDAMRRHLEFSNQTPARNLFNVLKKQVEPVRADLARAFGCHPEEMAITRNASEALETLIFGLDLEPGDEVIATNQNYPRMVNSWKQRARRQKIVFRTFPVPTNPRSTQELVDAFEAQITPRTRVLEVCHVTNRNGQIYPVRDIVRMARSRGVEVLVDGAHAFAHFPFRRDDLECDFYGTSLHKWLCAPHGTGFLYVRRGRIRDVWPLMAAAESQDDDIRKFEEIGTHPQANRLAVAEALLFHQGIGGERKAERLRHLSRHWIRALEGLDRVRLLTNDDPAQSCALRLLHIEGLDHGALASHLMKAHKIVVCPIEHPEFEGVRVTPNVYTTLRELDRFADAVARVVRDGLPG